MKEYQIKTFVQRTAQRLPKVAFLVATVFTVFISRLGAQMSFTDANWIGFGGTNTGLNGGVLALASLGPGQLYVGGGFSSAGGLAANRIAKWTASNWTSFGSGLSGFGSYPGNFSYYINPQLAVDMSGNISGLGTLSGSGYAAQGTNVVRWNGTNWICLGTNSGAGPGFAKSHIDYSMNIYQPMLFAMASDRSANVYLGGYFDAVDGAPVQGVAMWNGTNWISPGSGCEGYVTLLSSDPAGNIYAAGLFNWAGNTSANNIARWDGTNWFALGSGITCPPVIDNFANYIQAVVASGPGNVYAAGTFTNAGGVTVNHVAHWDGTKWSALGAGISGPVYALGLDSAGNLYAGGSFRIGGGVNATNIARWDGTNWSALGSGVNAEVHALAYDGNGHLFVGGYFTTAGTNASAYLAEAIVGIATNPPTLTSSNNPGGGISLSWPLDHTGWRLQSQRNPPGVGITSNWFTIPGSTNVNSTNFLIRTGAGSVFYRLVYP